MKKISFMKAIKYLTKGKFVAVSDPDRKDLSWLGDIKINAWKLTVAEQYKDKLAMLCEEKALQYHEYDILIDEDQIDDISIDEENKNVYIH
jgi:hypothetical protein